MFNPITTRQKLPVMKIAGVICCAFVLMGFPSESLAQDKIYKTDRTIVLSKVLKISDSEIEYKKFSNLNGPSYMLSKSEVTTIQYENGEIESFSQPKTKEVVVQTRPTYTRFTGVISTGNARNLVINGNINDAIAIYAKLAATDSTNVTLLLEYSYSLALGGIYDAALAHLDRIWNAGNITDEVYYYTSQVFALMGNADLADEFWKENTKNNSPGWIGSKAPEFIKTYGRKSLNPTIRNKEDLNFIFKQANKLASQNSNLQSIALFRDIVNQMPNEYIPYIGYSIPLEKTGLTGKAAQSVEKAIAIIQNDTTKAETKQFMEDRLVTLRNKIAMKQTANALGVKSKNGEVMSPSMLMYAGAMFGSGYSSLNCRLGYFLAETINCSLNLGLNSFAGSNTTNIGATFYSRDRIYVYGAGLMCNLGASTSVYAKISVGLSLMNKKQTSSYDIFIDGNAPLTKGYPTTFTMSIGKSIYFGKRK
jgi:tetratricopeptide (TPR) repeat protein